MLARVVKALKNLPSAEEEERGDVDSIPASSSQDTKTENADSIEEIISVSEASDKSECSSEEPSSDDQDLSDLESNCSAERILRAKYNTKSDSDGSIKDENDKQYFCVEDSFLSKDIKITVKELGEITFPITESTVQKLIQVSSKAKFGKGESTILDTSFRDTQVISAENLTVDISGSSLTDVLKRIGSGLNINPKSTLSIHLHNMLVYGPGQFFKKHRDSEKLPNMVATLVLVLPSEHTGGDLVIEHLKKKHVFFGSKIPDLVKCIAFYADCRHLIEPVQKGYRIALTYNIVLESSAHINMPVAVNIALDKSVRDYFDNTNSDMLVYLLNHMYSESSLRWDFLKGTDRIRAQALFAVAKKQGRVPFLALATYTEYMDLECDDANETSFSCTYWIDELNSPAIMDKREYSDDVSTDEICYTIKTTDLTETDGEEDEGPTGNEGHPVSKWYRRACIVLWASKWHNFHSCKNALIDIQKKTYQPGQQSLVLDEINKQFKDFLQPKFWKNELLAAILLDVVMYLGINDTTIQILSYINPKNVLKVDRVKFINFISKLNDFDTWNKMIDAWQKTFNLNDILSGILPFLEVLVSNEKDTVQVLMQKLIDDLIKEDESRNFYYCYGSNTDNLQNLKNIFTLCNRLKNENLEKKLLESPFCKKNIREIDDLLFLRKNISLEQFSRIQSTLVFAQIERCFGNTHYWDWKKKTLNTVCILLQICNEFKNEAAKNIMIDKIKSSNLIKSVDDIKLLEKYLSAEKISRLSGPLLQQIFDESIKKSTGLIANNSDNVHKNQKSISEICTFFKICLDHKNDSLILKIKDHLILFSSSLGPRVMAYIIIQLKQFLSIEKWIALSFNDLINHALKLINDELFKVSNVSNDWSINSKRTFCSCETCRVVKSFLNSKTLIKYVVPGGQKKVDHAMKEFGPLQPYLKMSRDTTTRPYKLNIEKLPKIIDDKKNAIRELEHYKNQLLFLINLKPPVLISNNFKKQKISE